jgi:DNA polymerase-3 subunit epsilon
MSTFAVVDFETTGTSPWQGARATEVAAVLLRDGLIVGRYESLMQTGTQVPPFIEALTGITDAMLRTAPPAARVMREVAAFAEGATFVAHNAHFDRTFWVHEARLAGLRLAEEPPFVCTLLLSRRLYPEAPNHKLGTLAAYHGIAAAGRAHRALADAEVTAGLFLRMCADIRSRFGAVFGGSCPVDLPLLTALQTATRKGLTRAVERYAEARAAENALG